MDLTTCLLLLVIVAATSGYVYIGGQTYEDPVKVDDICCRPAHHGVYLNFDSRRNLLITCTDYYGNLLDAKTNEVTFLEHPYIPFNEKERPFLLGALVYMDKYYLFYYHFYYRISRLTYHILPDEEGIYNHNRSVCFGTFNINSLALSYNRNEFIVVADNDLYRCDLNIEMDYNRIHMLTKYSTLERADFAAWPTIPYLHVAVNVTSRRIFATSTYGLVVDGAHVAIFQTSHKHQRISLYNGYIYIHVDTRIFQLEESELDPNFQFLLRNEGDPHEIPRLRNLLAFVLLPGHCFLFRLTRDAAVGEKTTEIYKMVLYNTTTDLKKRPVQRKEDIDSNTTATTATHPNSPTNTSQSGTTTATESTTASHSTPTRNSSYPTAVSSYLSTEVSLLPTGGQIVTSTVTETPSTVSPTREESRDPLDSTTDPYVISSTNNSLTILGRLKQPLPNYISNVLLFQLLCSCAVFLLGMAAAVRSVAVRTKLLRCPEERTWKTRAAAWRKRVVRTGTKPRKPTRLRDSKDHEC